MCVPRHVIGQTHLDPLFCDAVQCRGGLILQASNKVLESVGGSGQHTQGSRSGLLLEHSVAQHSAAQRTRMRMGGFLRIARANATRCFSPPLQAMGSSWRLVSRSQPGACCSARVAARESSQPQLHACHARSAALPSEPEAQPVLTQQQLAAAALPSHVPCPALSMLPSTHLRRRPRWTAAAPHLPKPRSHPQPAWRYQAPHSTHSSTHLRCSPRFPTTVSYLSGSSSKPCTPQ